VIDGRCARLGNAGRFFAHHRRSRLAPLPDSPAPDRLDHGLRRGRADQRGGVEEAAGISSGHGATIAGIFAGGVFFGGDWAIDRFGGADRKDATGAQESGSALAIVLGTVLDGIPESMVIGLTIFQGGAVGAAYLAAIFISNLPESISSTAGLVASGWKKARILWLWIGITLVSGLASLAGYGLFQDSSPDTVAFVLAFAAGAILTMLADTMMPGPTRTAASSWGS
jgi:ZIP family zinc transporter